MLVVLALSTTSLGANVGAASAATHRHPPKAAHTKPIPVSPVASHYHRLKPPATHRLPRPQWPSGSATVTLPGHAASPASARAGKLPVWLGSAPDKHAAHKNRASADTASAAGSSAKVRVLPQSAATAAGVHGVLVEVTPGAHTTGSLRLTLGYQAFKSAFGGDWSSRLGISSLPACALTSPHRAACRAHSPLPTKNNTRAERLTTTLPAQSTSSGSTTTGTRSTGTGTTAMQPMLLSADTTTSSSSGGGGGDFGQTSLSPSGKWQAGGSSDAFTWAYPISTPSVPGGLGPNLSFDYDSQSVDGLTSSTNNQASPVGDGFSLGRNFIERSYQSCHENPTGTTKTWDRCWSGTNQMVLSLNGRSSTLIKDDLTGAWHPRDDSNEKVEYLTGATNGAHNGEYWRVTTDDGTQYTFGLNRLPGFAGGDATTDSVQTEPVYATSSGQPCYNSTFADSWCQQAYRWNLDYVTDTHGDAISFFYTRHTGYYARDLGSTANTPYTRDAEPAKIEYGQRDGSVYSTTPAAQVLFTYNGRCNTSSTGCSTSTLSSSTASSWPDVPYDLHCAQNASCTVNSPSFWSEEELTGIQTQALVGTTEQDVDQWAMTYSFPATGDSTTPSLWLDSITRTGQDISAGGSSSPITLPSVTFSGTPLSNRVNTTDGYAPITRYRLNKIETETGELINVGYSSPDCASGTPSDPSQNTTRCYPSYWTPSGTTSPIEDWFNKFIVTGVSEQDPTGGGVNDTISTHYTPIGSPAWHYDDNPLTPSGQRTWNEWRGYQGMKVTTGTSPDPVTETDSTYFRGMDGDTLPNSGTRSVTVTDSRGDTPVTDLNQYAGDLYEKIVYNGSGTGKIVTDSVTDPWTSTATSTHALSGSLPSQQAFHTGSGKSRVFTPLASGSTQEREIKYTHDSYGRVTQTDDLGDPYASTDNLCTTTTYDDNTGKWILDTADETATVSQKCTVTPTYPDDAVSDVRTYYDNSTTFGAAPTKGDATMVRQVSSYSGSTPVWSTMSTGTVDEYGRAKTSTDADSRTTTTAYTPATGAEPTSIQVTDPLGHAATTSYDAVRELPLKVTSPAGYVTSGQYDALGRTTATFAPGISKAVTEYTYTLSNSAPSAVTTKSLNKDGSTYRISESLYDALLRERETQTATEDGGRNVTDTVYNTDGWTAKTTAPYYTSGTPSGTLVQAQDGDIPSETGYAYDGAARKTTATAYALGTETWHTTYKYGGNFTTTVPPAGATATTSLEDVRGRTTDLYEYHKGAAADPVNDPATDYSDTHYTYHPSGKQATVKDAAGNTWSWSYDLLGRQTSASDPDTGTTTSTYDDAGQLLTATDARGKQTTYTYDNDGRKKASYDTTGGAAPSTGNQTGAWTYDTIKKGYPTSDTAYQHGTTSTSVTHQVLGYTSMGKVAATRQSLANLPSNEAVLEPSGGYVTSYSYNVIGQVASHQDSAAGGLPTETVGIGYDTYGQPTSLNSTGTTAWPYADAIGYDEYGKVLQYTLGSSGNWVDLSLTYDPQTSALTGAKTTDSTSSTVVDNTTYTYADGSVSKGAGLVTATTDQQNGGAVTDTQCYTYDYATRLSSAWTATDNCATTPISGSSSTVGGPHPYWTSWTYNAAGDRGTETDHDTSGTTADDTTTTYAYPAQGSATDQPHTLTGTTATGPNASANTASYSYDTSGHTTKITGGSLGDQTLTWNDQGKLATDTNTTGTTSYLYDTSGNLVLRTGPSKAQLMVGDEEITENLSTQALSGTRYYSVAGATIAERSSSGAIQYLIPDHQGTATLAVDAQTQSVTRRQYTPFGATRGTAPTSWPGDRGYVGGTSDAATGLENLGAREYDPATGRFLSADHVLALDNPESLNGYDYADNSPVTHADPSGLYTCRNGHEGCDEHGNACGGDCSAWATQTGDCVHTECSTSKWNQNPDATLKQQRHMSYVAHHCDDLCDTLGYSGPEDPQRQQLLKSLYDPNAEKKQEEERAAARRAAKEVVEHQGAAAAVAAAWAFGQARVGPNFSAPIEAGGQKYRTIEALADAIKKGKVDVGDIQIEAFKRGNVSVSLSNRRFTAIIKAGKLPTNVVYRDPTPNELKRLNETSVLGEELPSRSIAITPSMKNKTVIDEVSVDNVDAAAMESQAMTQAETQAAIAQAEAEVQAEEDMLLLEDE
ncbi:RHS repeat-associated core domain-containing protein [Streptomyces sediminimaris]|uniref:RHS repeat-associated core domain-containing protein n=1 Tax=Streptomyces sediminimaris TaxID=3383721 RepID=UPI003999EF6C